MIQRPCLDCGALHTNQSRCDRHKYSEGKRSGAHSDPEYRRNRNQLIREHIKAQGFICPGAPDLDHEAHPCTDLTADHIIQVADGGSHSLHNLRVLCKSANSARNRRP